MNILVPYEFTPKGDIAVNFAIEFMLNYSGKVTLLHVVPIDVISIESPAYIFVSENLDLAQTHLNKLVEDLKVKHNIGDDKISCIAKNGTILQGIESTLEKYDIDVICMNTHNKVGFFYKLMGSVSEQVLQHVKTPTLFLHNEGVNTVPIQRMLFLVSDLKQIEKSVPSFIGLNKKLNATVDVMHFAEKEHDLSLEAMKEFKDEYEKQSATFNYEFIVNYADDLYLAIKERMVTEKYDLIVLVKRDRSMFSEMLVQSTSMYFLHRIKTPMLILHD